MFYLTNFLLISSYLFIFVASADPTEGCSCDFDEQDTLCRAPFIGVVNLKFSRDRRNQRVWLIDTADEPWVNHLSHSNAIKNFTTPKSSSLCGIENLTPGKYFFAGNPERPMTICDSIIIPFSEKLETKYDKMLDNCTKATNEHQGTLGRFDDKKPKEHQHKEEGDNGQRPTFKVPTDTNVPSRSRNRTSSIGVDKSRFIEDESNETSRRPSVQTSKPFQNTFRGVKGRSGSPFLKSFSTYVTVLVATFAVVIQSVVM